MAPEGIPYANEKAVELASSFEKRIQEVSPHAGLLFVSVRAEPVLGGESNTFHIILGIDRKFEELTGQALMKKVFEKEIEDGQVVFTAKVFRGTNGAASYSPTSGPRELPA